MGKVLSAERVPGSRKLVKLIIDLGGTTRQAVAGLGDQYEEKDLVSRLVAVVTNLKPKKIFGVESDVMILAAVEGQRVSILGPNRDVAPGAQVL